MSNSSKKCRKQTDNSRKEMDRMKYEIANEFGVNLGGDSSSRANGRVGGEITRRLVKNGKNKSNRRNNKKCN